MGERGGRGRGQVRARLEGEWVVKRLVKALEADAWSQTLALLLMSCVI